jgi:two-component system sensor histidine kinase BaeS
MSVRMKLFAAMATLILFVEMAYFGSTQGYLHGHLPKLVAAARQADSSAPMEQDIYNEMVRVSFKVIAGLSLIALAIGFWLSRMLTAPLLRLKAALDRVGSGDLQLRLPVTSHDEYGKVAEAVNRMAANLARSEEVRKHMVADIAHELRTPLTILKGKFELIQQSGQAVPPATLLPLQDEVIRLSKLVTDLHQLSQAEAGVLRLEKQRLDLLGLLRPLLELLSVESEDKGVRLLLDSSVPETELFADPQRITQIFYNLIGNAIRHTPAGGQVAIRLEERTEARQRELVIIVADTGVGIAAEHVAFVFERFYRAADDRSRQSGGAGLGLAIAKQFAEAHGGRIEVASEPGRGTEFRVTLPAGLSAADG